jgi:predicted nucleic acid-binding protein
VSKLRAVFVDTGAWVALRYGRDQHHGRARTLLQRLRKDAFGLLTTEWVLAESTPERRRRAWELFVRYRDRRVGWVDCASFAVMALLAPVSPSCAADR